MSKEAPPKPAPKVLLWDIEASNLVADYGYTFCIGYKWLDEPKTHLLKIRDFPRFKRDCTDDKDLLRAWEPIAEKADVMVTWFGTYYDEPFIQTRRLIQDLGSMWFPPHYDGWKISRYKLKLRSNRLEAVSRIIPCSREEMRRLKVPVSNPAWIRGAAGHIPSLKEIEAHCIADVQVLEDAWKKLRAFAGAGPNLSKVGGVSTEGCPVCGSPHIHSQGKYKLTPRGFQRSYRCTEVECGKYFSLPIKSKVA